MWYRFEEGNPIGIPRVKEYQVVFYDMERRAVAFDEAFYSPDELNKVIPFVETVEDIENENPIKSRVFVHFDNGDMYELKLEYKNNKKKYDYYYK